MTVQTLVPLTRNGDDANPASAQSTGIADPKSVTPPKGTRAIMMCAKTTNVRVTFDGATPDPTARVGLVIVAGAQPVLIPFAPPTGTDLKWCSDAAGNSELDCVFLE